MTREEKHEWILNATYEELLKRWRNSPVGDKMFKNDDGFYKLTMDSKKNHLYPGEAVRISKKIGFFG